MSKLSCPTDPMELLLRSILQRVTFSVGVVTPSPVALAGACAVAEDASASAGRRPAGLLSEARDRHLNKFGDYLARCAHLEAASVIAFERLARELSVHGAPRALVEGALAARADEVRHAEVIGRMARVYGGEPVEPMVSKLSTRALEAIALENAVEGCVRETFGALLGGFQAMAAPDVSLRTAMLLIARDEARHAALAHRVHRWLHGRLDTQARARVRHAQERAIFGLAAELATPSDPEVQHQAGLPSPELSRRLLAELARSLWKATGPVFAFKLRALV